ncbi:hypothetical protein OL548_15230 [Lysinibacillus sp. MHQ-1]|nr:hypothetical protein OL548_15230 [Lysinibacillus sp. MHQ-1]
MTAYQRGQSSLIGKALEESVQRHGTTFHSVIKQKIVHLKNRAVKDGGECIIFTK